MRLKSQKQISKIVGKNIRLIRRQKEWSQKEFARRLKISFQQVQKYEGGENRISAPRLYHICQILDINASVILGQESLFKKSFWDFLKLKKKCNHVWYECESNISKGDNILCSGYFCKKCGKIKMYGIRKKELIPAIEVEKDNYFNDK